MILKKNKLKIFTTIVTAFTIFFTIILSIGNATYVNADIPGTSYYKYTYATKAISEYTLSAIPETDISSRNAISTYSDDNRELASLEQTIVSIKGFTPTENDGVYNMSLGTGFIIGDHEIMTAAHVIYNGTFGNTPSIEISNSNPQNSDSIVLTPIAAHVPKLFNSTDCFETYDYAIITVEEDLSNYGEALLGVITDNAINNHISIHNLGYAYYNNINCALKISNGNINQSTNDGTRLIANVYSYGGTSGGPVYVETDYGNLDGSNTITYKTVVGIISQADSENGITTCSQIRPALLKFAYNNSNL